MTKGKSLVSMIGIFLRGLRRYFAVGLFFATFAIIFNFLTPQVIRFTVDSVLGVEPMNFPGFALDIIEALGGREMFRANLIFCALGVVLCALLAGSFNYLSRMQFAKGAEGFTKKLRDTLFEHIQRLPFSWHNDTQTGDIIQRCTSDVETLREFVARQLIEVLRTVLLLVVALVLMFSMNTTLALVCLAFMPIIVLYSLFFHKRVSRQFLAADEAEGELMVDVQENLTGVRVVRAFGREKYEREKFNRKNDDFTNKWVDMGYTLGLYWGIGDFETAAQILAIVCTGSFLAAKGQITLGELLTFVLYTQTLSWPVRSLGRTLSELSKAGVSLKRVKEILDAEEESRETNPLDADYMGDIEFKNVSFSYGEYQVLRDLSFKVHGGETFGILGATGSGKSTITYLLNRLYDLEPEGGDITIGGVSTRGLDRGELRRNVGLVLQEPFLFSKTILENILIASGGAAESDVHSAARTADVHENILEFPRGYNTIVGERGVTLSGGQKQRVAMARTLILGCPIMVFDDSMSAVDMETDERIRKALTEDTGGSTVILISHRISTLMTADHILVLDDGNAVEYGTHAELIAKDGMYSRVYKMQSDAGLFGAGGE